MTESRENALGLDQAPSQHIPKPWVIPVPKGTLQHIFGTSQVFQNFDDIKPKAAALTVPLKVREYYHRGHQCLEQEDWEVAVLFFSRGLHLDSQLVEFYALRAEAYIQLCDFSSAAQNLRKAYSSQPENTDFLERLTLVLYLKGQCLFEQCAFLDALNVFSQASELQPEKFCFRYRCMACLLALKRHRECLSFVTKEVEHGTANADVYILRARLYNFFQQPSLCHQDLHSALLLDPRHPQAKVLLKVLVGQAQETRQEAGVLAVQGKLQHALQCINCAIENNPLDPSLFLFRGIMYRRLREFDSAVEDFLKALDMMTEHQEDLVQQAQRQLLLAYNDLAVHCYLQGAYQESVLLLSKALKDEQREKGLYINRGDCFFQLGNLTFAEADYQQALALSPKDEGAHLRMDLLQEKLGFCEQRRRQFQKTENHFSMAIQNNPQKPQYYLYRTRSRQLTQNTFGARQDVATVLLLDPKQPKLLPLMANLFPGLSVEELLNSQVAHLARLQLERVVEHSLQAGTPQDIVGRLKERELERQRARALQLSWKLEQPLFETSKELEATHQSLQAQPEGPEEEAKAPGEKEKLEPAPSKERSLTDGYISQTSSGSILGFRTTSTSETETSTVCQEYGSTSTTVVTFSDSSPLRTQSSDSRDKREDLSLSHSPRKTKSTPGHSQRPSEPETIQVQSQRPSRTEAALSQSQRPSRTEAIWVQSQRPSRTEAALSQSQRPSRTEAALSHSQRPSRTEAALSQSQRPSRTEAALSHSQRPSRTEAALSQSQRPSRTEADQIQSQRPSEPEADQIQSRRPSEPEAIQVQSQRPSRTEADQIQSRRPSRTEADQIQSRRPSRTEAIWVQSQRPSRTEADQIQSQRPSRTEAALSQSQRPSRTEAALSQSQRPSRTEADQIQSQRPSEPEADQIQSRRPSEPEAIQVQSQRPSRTEADQIQSRRPSRTEAIWVQSQRPSRTEAALSQSRRPSRTEAIWVQSQRPSRTEAIWVQSQRPSRTEAIWVQSQRPSRTEAIWVQSQRASRTEAIWVQSQRPSRTEAAWSPRRKLDKTKATQGSRQRLRKAKGAHGQNWRPRKAGATQDWSWRLIQSPSKIKTFYDPSWSPCNTEATEGQGQSQRPSESKAAQSWSQSTSPGSGKTKVTWGLSPSLSNMQTTQGLRQNPSPSSQAAV
ncbi:tetratricopeptide repeat protein 16 isoform X1 [Orcinus orca]|uniref:tetratricopeptide repeat protein 16 isoform X1 n=2 Tax=Orcinus orca TaxID=9733 RepID=UPI002111ACA8|nr:tetratricopeptide repeat protein 16 isoform X1 [Orcinus orca]